MAQSDQKDVTVRESEKVLDKNADEMGRLHRLMLDYLKSWLDGTELWRPEALIDLEYINGRQGQKSRQVRTFEDSLLKKNRHELVFNEIRPQAELMAGEQRRFDFQFNAVPRGREDRRLSEITSATLKAAFEYANEPRESGKVFDDATATGLGAGHDRDWETALN